MNNKQGKKVLVLLYSHPEHYPPTLNAIRELAKCCEHIALVYRSFQEEQWNYPHNVELIPDKKFISALDQQQSPLYRKIYLFFNYTILVIRTYLKFKPDIFLVYDPLPTLSWSILNILKKKNYFLWYHNHDVLNKSDISSWSISAWALKAERKILKDLDLFSLPSIERKQYFTPCVHNDKFVHLPNYPAADFYTPFRKIKVIDDEIKLVYQGKISRGHGIEHIIKILDKKIIHKKISLHLIGNVTNEYKEELVELNRSNTNRLNLHFYGYVSYNQLPSLSSQFHIGIAINEPNDIIYKTGGTASNKIYEYAALGLPILYFDDAHYNKYLEKYPWAYATSLTVESTENALSEIVKDYSELSNKAYGDFINELSFEKQFKQIQKKIFKA